MGVIYIVSVEEGAGKTSLCVGLAKNILDAGKNAGYLKPHTAGIEGSDSDIIFMKHVLGLDDVVNAPDIIRGRDEVFVEAMVGQTEQDPLSQSTYGAAREMQAKVIAVEPYSETDSGYADVYKGFGENLLGVVINKVPDSQTARVKEAAAGRLEAAGIKLLGVIPENRTLLAVTVGELAEKLSGTIINNQEKASDLVENFMLGAMIVDSGLDYFGRMSNKAAIVRQDRPDMQLAALETSTSCLVLGGSAQPPLYNVQEKASYRGIPVITTDTAVSDIADAIDDILMTGRMNQEKKLSRLTEMVKQNLDIAALV
ncbi:MAG: DRTGG domain-containing protein [Dehalococcoidales bacterium]|nr:DRTGG domain-containing protein [Dehalococcoidales bacterium]